MTQKTRARRAFLPGSVRLAALVLAALALFASLSARPAQAAEWMTPYLEQVQEWGVMRGDANGNLNEDRSITRAEFVTLVNRAFGYTEVGPNTFTDVPANAWYAEDISIAHQAGYFNGTSPTTASPLSLVTREQAAVLLGRCLRLQGTTGAAGSSFTDVYQIGGWSRGLVQEAADLGIIQGYADGSFRPSLPITRGQMACFLVRALGTLIQEPGEQSSGGVYGNLTINTPGVKLKDTTITGNLYLTGGVGLGSVELENVNVLGKIVVCGTGEAEGGKNSVILRNVTAGSLEIDSLTEQFLSVQAQGLTDIGTTTVRTSAYLEDLTEDGLGFKAIRLDGVEGAQFQLAGNIKEVVNLTPSSALQIAQGVAAVVTMDEKAQNASLVIDNQAYIQELNLDAATPVTGAGSVTHLNINAPGSNVSMLPDTIYVRPGITGNISNVNMDNKAAAESSEDPRLLAGYPKVKNIATTSADALFSANKSGTIYWAVTALMDGSVGEEELMNPGAYPKILRSGTVAANAAKTEFTARLTGLTKEGSYYVSALLVDARGRRSPVKVAAFTTPDDSAPNFANGYPQDPILTTDADGEQVAQIMVMPTKNCQMYYVLLPSGSTAPTAADFRAAALPGNLGYGIVDLRKNTPFLVSRINTSHLQEKTNYDLYLWLNDADNGKSSAVRKITVTTKDMTPPNITDLGVRSFTSNTVTVRFILDEPGTLSWAAVKQGASIRVDTENPTLNDQIKIESIPADGVTVIRRGGPVRAAQGGVEYTFTISGLQPQTAYDLYYMAKDTAGNYCVYNKSIAFPYPIRTQDTQAPTAWMWFQYFETDPDTNEESPRLDSDIGIQFSEEAMGVFDQAGADPDNFHELYAKVANSSGEAKVQAKNDLAQALNRHLTFWTGTPSGNAAPLPQNAVFNVFRDGPNLSAEELDEKPAWYDLREAIVTREEVEVQGANGATQTMVGTRITLPAGKGIKLQSGSHYFFRLTGIIDTSPSGNPMSDTNLDDFSTLSARVEIGEISNVEYMTVDGKSRQLTIFRLDPNEATAFSPDNARWDLVLWAHSNIEYNLYVREPGGEWFQLTEDSHPLHATVSGSRVYHSLYGNLGAKMIESGLFGMEQGQGRPYLKDLTGPLEFAILSTEGGQNGPVDMEAEIYTGTDFELAPIGLYGQGDDRAFDRLQRPLERVSYHNGNKFYDFTVPSDQTPVVRLEFGSIQTFPTSVSFQVNLNMSGKVYCLAVPVTGKTDDSNYNVDGSLYPRRTAGGALVPLSEIPVGAANETISDQLWLAEPTAISISDPPRNLPATVRTANTGDTFDDDGGFTDITIDGLSSETQYILYLVSTNTYNTPARDAKVLCYQFTTTPPNPPVMVIRPGGTAASIQFYNKEDLSQPLQSQMAQVLVRSDFFTRVSNNDYSKLMSQFLAEGKTLPSDYANLTVLQAMQKTVNSGISVFDEYASVNAKRDFRDNVRTYFNSVFSPDGRDYYLPSSTGSDLGSGSVRYTSKDLTFNLTDSNEYVLLVVAMGYNSNIEDPNSFGFRASWPYKMEQSNFLTVRGSADNETPDADTFTGTLTLFFSHKLRYIKNESDPGAIRTFLEIDACERSHPLHVSDSLNHIGSNGCTNLHFATLGPGVKLIDPALNPAMGGDNSNHGGVIEDRLIFDLTEKPSGGLVINLGSRITGNSADVRPGEPVLEIHLNRDDNGVWDIAFEGNSNYVDWKV